MAKLNWSKCPKYQPREVNVAHSPSGKVTVNADHTVFSEKFGKWLSQSSLDRLNGVQNV